MHSMEIKVIPTNLSFLYPLHRCYQDQICISLFDSEKYFGIKHLDVRHEYNQIIIRIK